MKKITWSAEAEEDYLENIEYLLREWSISVTEEFIQKVEEIIDNLKSELVSYQSANYKGINKCVVCKQITLYYKEKNKTEIELIRFWNTFKDEKRLKL